MHDQALVKLITQRVVSRLSNDQPCSGCALRSCDAGKRACDVAAAQQKYRLGFLRGMHT
jgi:hypothetical protein